ncbi:MAG: hypothetical protein IJV19_06605 [Prevotella sp.]|nr:hypothetical protein [Prevotella sp.]
MSTKVTSACIIFVLSKSNVLQTFIVALRRARLKEERITARFKYYSNKGSALFSAVIADACCMWDLRISSSGITGSQGALDRLTFVESGILF